MEERTDARALAPGDLVAERYRVVEALGAGGMGTVFRAQQIALGRDVALKVVHRDHGVPDAAERFKREAELAAKVEHRNVVGILDYGATADGTQFLVMPLLKGESFDARLRREPRPSIGEVLGVVRGLLGGLAAIHAQGIVHRDLKPANVFLAGDADGIVPTLLDFGISRPKVEARDAALTAAHVGIGTPEYMAPEQFESARTADERADLWGVGAILYAAFAGRPPFEGADAFAIYRAILSGEPAPIASLNPTVPAELAALVHRALRRDPSERFQSAREMRDAIDAIVAGGIAGDARSLVVFSSISGASVPPTAAGPIAHSPIARTVAMSTPAPIPAGAPSLADAALPDAFATPKRGRARVAAAGALAVFVCAGGAALWYATDDAEPEEIRLEPRAAPPAATAPVPVSSPIANSEARGIAVSAPGELLALARHWAYAPESLRSLDLRFVPRAGEYVAVAAPATPSTEAFELATYFGSQPSRADPPAFDDAAALEPALLRTNARTNVRAEASTRAPVASVLPDDGLVVGLYGPIRGVESRRDGEGAMTYFAVAREAGGWAAPRLLEPYHGCAPDPTALLEGIAERLGYAEDELYDDEYEDPEASADREATLLELAERLEDGGIYARTHVLLDGRRQEAVLIAGVTSLERRESLVAVFVVESGCETTCIEARELDGVLDEFFLTETMPGGESLLAFSRSSGLGAADGFLSWEAGRMNPWRSLWTDRLPTGANLPESRQGGVAGSRDRVSRREPFALGVRRPGQDREWFVYTDGALRPEAPPLDPTPPEPTPEP